MPKTLTQKEYIQRLSAKNIEVLPLENYINARTKISHRCMCGTIWKQSPGKVLRGLKCPDCHGRKYTKVPTQDEYIGKLKSKGIAAIPLENYINARTKISHRCICGTIWNVWPNKVLAGRKCGKCKTGRTHMSHSDFINKLPKDIIPLEEYKGSGIKINFLCSCGKKILSSPGLMYNGCHCEDKRDIHNINFYKNKRTILYYIKIGDLWKIGITLFRKSIEHSVLKSRFKADIRKGIPITIIKTKIFEDGSEAFISEQTILKEFKEYRYMGENLIRSGNTEMFNIDINKLK